jgi:uncharacterized protein (TIGR02147 family)
MKPDSGKGTESQEAPRVFGFSDYRSFLSAYFAHRKAAEPGFSLRVFARNPELGLSSSSFLSAVLKGRKNLSQSLRLRFGRALGLGAAEQDYFEALIQADQSRTPEERSHFQARLARLGGAGARAVADAGRLFHSRWWYAVVWHWLGLHPGQSNPVRIARFIRPRLDPAQVEEAIKVLGELRLIKRLANGYAVAERHVAAAAEMEGEPARAYIRDFLGLAAGGLEDAGSVSPGIPPAARAEAGARPEAVARAFQVMTFALGPRAEGQLRAKLAALGAELRDLSAGGGTAGEGGRVYALAVQLFACSDESEPPEGLPAHGHAGPGTTAELSILPG